MGGGGGVGFDLGFVGGVADEGLFCVDVGLFESAGEDEEEHEGEGDDDFE